MLPTFGVVVSMAMAAVSSTFGLKGSLHSCKLSPKAMQHILDHMVGTNEKNLVSNFSGQMPVSQVPGKSHKLIGILVPYFDNQFRSGLDLQPSSIVQLQAISIRHCNDLRKVEKDIFTLISSQTNAAAVARIKVESESASCLFLRPIPRGAMN